MKEANKEVLVTDLKNTDDIKHYIVTTLGNLGKLYEESENTIDSNLLYSLGERLMKFHKKNNKRHINYDALLKYKKSLREAEMLFLKCLIEKKIIK